MATSRYTHLAQLPLYDGILALVKEDFTAQLWPGGIMERKPRKPANFVPVPGFDFAVVVQKLSQAFTGIPTITGFARECTPEGTAFSQPAGSTGLALHPAG